MTKLIDDIKDWYKDSSYPPDGPDVNAELVSEKDISELRWGTAFVNVYKRPNPRGVRGIDQYVAVKDVRPATEMQGWGDYGKPEIYLVKPKTETITVTTYEKVDS